MKKWLRRIGIGLLVVVVILVLVVSFSLGPIVEKGVVAAGPAMIGVPITLKEANIRLLRGNVDLKELIIGNPEGYKSDYAFRLGQFTIDMVPRSVVSDTIRIKEIVIDGPEIIYEMSISGSNLGAILKGLESDEMPAPEKKEPAKKKAGKTQSVQIDRLVIRNGTIRLTSKLLQGNAVTLPLPTIELKDIGKKDDEKTTIVGVIRKVLHAVITSVTTVVTGSGKLLADGAGAALDLGVAGAGAAANAAVAGAGMAADGAVAVGKGAAEGAKVVGKGAAAVGGAVGRGAGKVIGGVGGLFKHGDDKNSDDAGAPTEEATGDDPETPVEPAE